MSGYWRFPLLLSVFGFVLASVAFGQYEDELWTVRSDYIYLNRSDPISKNLVTKSSSSGTVLLNADQFDLGNSPGWDVSLMRRNALGTDWCIEGLFFSVDNWLATVPEVASTGSYIRYKSSIGTASAATFTSSLHSGLHNVEINARRAIGRRGEFIMGFRYVNLSERLYILQHVPSFSDNWMHNDVNTTNNMLGVQIGYDGHVFNRGRLAVDGFVKAGLYNNIVDNSAVVFQTASTDYDLSGVRAARTSFVGDASITGTFKVNKYLSVRAGYEFLLIGGAALVTDQVPVLDPKNNSGNVSYDASPFYHGAYGGLEFKY